MPVNVLFCEGGSKSPDLAVIRSVSGLSDVRPAGGKGLLKSYMHWVRYEARDQATFALRDRDFDSLEISEALDEPRVWLEKNNQERIHFGWTWARNCLENYLIDPIVVDRVLGAKLKRNIYVQELEKAAISLSCYTAARYALSNARSGSLMLANAWGKRCGPDAKHHLLPLQRERDDCYRGIDQVIQNLTQNEIPSAEQVKSSFDELLPTCLPGGARFLNYLTYFSGKDLMAALEPFLMAQRLGDAGNFRARIVAGLVDTPEDVWEWLPEWGALRRLVHTFV